MMAGMVGTTSLTPPPLAVRLSGMDVVVLAYPGFQGLDVSGPFEVFAAANAAADGLGHAGSRYRLSLVAPGGGAVSAESGLTLLAGPLPPPGQGNHTLVLPGGDGVYVAAASADLVGWVADTAARSARVACVCSGAFLAGAAGLLTGRTVTTHWARARSLARRYPDCTVDPDAIYRRDGELWTSAGVTAGIDLALALVEHDLGTEVAQTVARWLVVFLRRPGGQSQFAAPVWSEAAERAPIRAAQDRIAADPAGDCSVAALARHAGLSERHFARLFTAEVGESPARYVERLRVEAARRLLETGDAGLAAVARHCGFGSAETLRRAFLRRVGVPPDSYRHRFRLAAPPT
jgi:transcriptional regulator GlxA family with amidase domain